MEKIFLNRELQLIEFYNRVLAKTYNKSIPLLERVTYLGIVCKNCDELFEVRIARLQKFAKDTPDKILPDGLTASESLAIIKKAIDDLYINLYKSFYNEIIPSLKKENIIIMRSNEWTKKVKDWAYNYFMKELKPMLTPIGIDPAHPFPRVPNKFMHFAVELNGVDEFGRHSKIAIVEAPRVLQRVIKIPSSLTQNKTTFILLQDIISANVSEFFHGLTVKGCYPFRVTRAADLTVSQNTKNIRANITQEIHNRKFAECSRLELDVSSGTPDALFINSLLNQFKITKQVFFPINGPLNLSRFSEISSQINRPELKWPPFVPGMPKELAQKTDIFKEMEKGDILIHTPYQSFDPVVELTRRAVTDPDVLAIKMTVYRTGIDSELVQNLIKAAQAGKQVIASVELLARFDEEVNVALANALENAGAHVVYGVMGYKVHAKMLLIVRKDQKGGLKYYTHLGTGNYHQSTAKIYSDFSLLTTNPIISHDVDNIFSQITGIGRSGALNKLFQSPFTLYPMLISKINTEIEHAKNGGKGLVIAKMNTLLENSIIEKLYEASKAGVEVKLIVRGACALKPQVKGLSENIHVYSIVGRFLEHHRVFYFYNAGNEDLFMSSADWMKRNLFKRVETCIPILNDKIKARIINEGLNIYLNDDTDAWEMQSDGTWISKLNKNSNSCAQNILMKKLGNK